MKKSNSKKEAKINKKNSCYKKNNENSNNNSSSTTEEEKAELLNQIGILDLSLFKLLDDEVLISLVFKSFSYS